MMQTLPQVNGAPSVSVVKAVTSIKEAVPRTSLYYENRGQEELPMASKICILSDQTIRFPVNVINPLPGPSNYSTMQSCFNQPTCSTLVSTPLTSPTYSTVSSTHFFSSGEVTPRKRKLLNKLERVERVSAKRKLKLTLLKRKLVRKQKKISNMKTILKSLKKKKFMEEETLDMISKLGGPQELYCRQYKKSLKKKLPKKYSDQLKVFALTLHYYSPAAYKYVRRTFNTCLPHTRTISRWYQSINGLPGFTSEAFEALRLKASYSDSDIICSLVMDEMAIRQHEEWVPSQGKSYGYVDMGTGSTENTIASNALVFLLNCVNGSWKIPVGYFLISGIKAESKKGLVQECLKKCFEVGIKVISLTFDGAPTNLTMANLLGCNFKHTSLKTNFQHPSSKDEIVVLLDACHMLKLVRNTLGEKGSMVNRDNALIEWRFFKQLHELQDKEAFHLANKLREQHIKFTKQKMKVRLATQIFSESVAKALEFCSEVLMLQNFTNVGPTVEFIKIMNSLFDILNSRNLFHFSFKKPLCMKNANVILPFLDKADSYIRGLKTHCDGTSLLDTNRHTGFLGLRVCISSVKLLYSNLIVKQQCLKYLPTYKLSQDCLELFFCSIRAQGGYNNNPTARQFQAAYKKLLVHVEVKESFRGNCIPLEELSILKINPIHQINVTSREYSASDFSSFDYTSLENDHNYLPDPLSIYAKNIIVYIAGYVVHYLKAKIVCEQCLDTLISTSRDTFLYSFIDLKNKSGLQYPSEDVIEICLKCERILKHEIIVVGIARISIDKIKNLILRQFVSSNIFSNLVTHSFDQNVLDNHRFLLIKIIIERYLNVRIIYLYKNNTNKNKATSIRHSSNKIVLFSGQ